MRDLESETINDDMSLGGGETTEEEDITSTGTAKRDKRKKGKLSSKLAAQNKLSGSLLPSQVSFMHILTYSILKENCLLDDMFNVIIDAVCKCVWIFSFNYFQITG